MSENTRPTNPVQTANEPPSEAAVALTPELIQQVTDKVYALLQRDLQFENERARSTRPSARWRF